MASNLQNASGSSENDFEYYLSFVRPLVLALSDPNDRIKAAAWVKRLKENDIGIGLRTIHLKLLIFVLQQRKLIGPFKEHPQNVDLTNIPEGSNVTDIAHALILTEQQKNLNIFGSCDSDGSSPSCEISSDALEFASSQRIPHFGVQAFYAISREPIISWNNLDTGLIPPEVLKSLEDEASGILSTIPVKPPKSLIESVKTLSPKIKTPERPSKPSITPSKGQVGLLGFVPPPSEERKPITWGSNLIELTETPAEPIEIPATLTVVEEVPVQPVLEQQAPAPILPPPGPPPPPTPRTPVNPPRMPHVRRQRPQREKPTIAPRRLFGESYVEATPPKYHIDPIIEEIGFSFEAPIASPAKEYRVEFPESPIQSLETVALEHIPQVAFTPPGRSDRVPVIPLRISAPLYDEGDLLEVSEPEVFEDSLIASPIEIPQLQTEREGFAPTQIPLPQIVLEKSPMTKARDQMRLLYGEDRTPPFIAEKSPISKARDQMRLLYGEDRTPPFIAEKSPISKAREQMRLLYGEDRTPPFIREKSPMSKAREQMRLLYGEDRTPPFAESKGMMINIPTSNAEERDILEEANQSIVEQDIMNEQLKETPRRPRSPRLVERSTSPDLFDRMVSGLGDDEGLFAEQDDILDEDLDLDLYTDLVEELKQIRRLRNLDLEDLPLSAALPMTSPSTPTTPTRRGEYGDEFPIFEEEMPAYFTPEKTPRSKVRAEMRMQGQRIPAHLRSPELDELGILKYVPPSPVKAVEIAPSPPKPIPKKVTIEPTTAKERVNELLSTASTVENSKKLYDTLLSDETDRPIHIGTRSSPEPALDEDEEVLERPPLIPSPPSSPEFESYPEDLFGTAANVPYERPQSLLDEGIPDNLGSPIRPPIVIPGWKTPEHLRIEKPKPVSPYLPYHLGLPKPDDYLWNTDIPEEFYSPEKPPITPPRGPVMPSYEEYADPFSELNQQQYQMLDLEEEEEPLRYDLEAHEMVPYKKKVVVVQAGGRAKRVQRKSAPPDVPPISEEEEMYLLNSPIRSPPKYALLDFGAPYMPPSSAPQRARGYYSSPVRKLPTSPIPLPWYPSPVADIQQHIEPDINAPQQHELLTNALQVVQDIEKSPMTKVREQMRMLYGEDVSPPFIGGPPKSPMARARDLAQFSEEVTPTSTYEESPPGSPFFGIVDDDEYADLHIASPPKDFEYIDEIDARPEKFDFTAPVEEFMPQYGAFQFDVGDEFDLEGEEMPFEVQQRMVRESPERPRSPEQFDREEFEQVVAGLPSKKELYPSKFYYVRQGWRGGPFITIKRKPSTQVKREFNQLNPIRELPAHFDDDVAAFNYHLEKGVKQIRNDFETGKARITTSRVRPSTRYPKSKRLPGITEEIQVESPVKRGGRPGIPKRRRRIDFDIPGSPPKPPVLSPRSQELANIMARAESLPQEQVILPEDLMGYNVPIQYTPPRSILDEGIPPDAMLHSPMRLPIQIPGWKTPEHLRISPPKAVTPPGEEWIRGLGFPQSIRAEVPPDLFDEVLEDEYDSFEDSVHKEVTADFRRYPSGTMVETTEAIERPISAADKFSKPPYEAQYERQWEGMQERDVADLDVSMPDFEFVEDYSFGEDERLQLTPLSPRTPQPSPKTPKAVSPRTPPPALPPSPDQAAAAVTSPLKTKEQVEEKAAKIRQPMVGFQRPQKPAKRKPRASVAPAMPPVSEEEEMYLLNSPIRSPPKYALIDFGAPYMPPSSAPQRARGYYSSPVQKLPTSPIPLKWYPTPEMSPISKARHQMKLLFGEDVPLPFISPREKSPITKSREQMVSPKDVTPPIIVSPEKSPITKAREQMRMLYGEDVTPPFISPTEPALARVPFRSPYKEEDFQAVVPQYAYDLQTENLDFDAPEYIIEEDEASFESSPYVSPLVGRLGEDFDVISRTAFQYEFDQGAQEGLDILGEEMPAFYSPPRTPPKTPKGPITRPSPYLETTPTYTPPRYVPEAQFIDVDYPTSQRTPTQAEMNIQTENIYADIHPLDRVHPLEEVVQLQPAIFDADRFELNWQSPPRIPSPPPFVHYVPPPLPVPTPPSPVTPPRATGEYATFEDEAEPALVGTPVRENIFEQEYFFGEDLHTESPPRLGLPQSPRTPEYLSPTSPKPIQTPPQGPSMMSYGEYMRAYSPSDYSEAPEALSMEVRSHSMVPYSNRDIVIKTGRRSKRMARSSAAPRLERVEETIPQSEMSPLSRAREQMRILYGEDISPPFLSTSRPGPSTSRGPARKGIPRRII